MEKKLNRVYHRWEKWECYPAGFYEVNPPKNYTHEDCQMMYASFLSDLEKFENAARRVINEWVNSTEHNLTNETMNRIAWIGQAAMCIETGIPAKYRGGYHLLTPEQQINADLVALKIINEWMSKNGYFAEYTLETIKSRTEANLY
jgi:hypothetical protein